MFLTNSYILPRILFPLMDAWAFSIDLAHLPFTTVSSVDAQVEGIRNASKEPDVELKYPVDPGLVVQWSTPRSTSQPSTQHNIQPIKEEDVRS